jgi:demethylmenaquinone methyltransferase/2-methoxy-6-polyprenyl-1,4-benzoquinol methylase
MAVNSGCRVVGTVEHPTTSPPAVADELFAPIATTYERWARLLSMGQDARWRRAMVDGLDLAHGSLVLDVAAGTGSISRQLRLRGVHVVAVDQNPEMITIARSRGVTAVLATAERLPFADATFDGVTFGYLLRYVDDVANCMDELARVVRLGGVVAMVEFGRPQGKWFPAWWLYTRTLLPLAGSIIGSGWSEVGRFLGPNIDAFALKYPLQRLTDIWSAAGLSDVHYRQMSLGGGLVMWGRRR